MKTLVTGDLHAKYHILEKIIELGEGYDKVVFLGDYVDDWNAVPDASYNTLSRLIEYKKANPEKVVLICGNHDLSEGFGEPFRCSGFNQVTSILVQPIFLNNMELFDVAYAEGNTLFTHAGLTKSWWDKRLAEQPQMGSEIENYVKYLNWAFHNHESDDLAEKVFYDYADAGYMRGGSGTPSPTWADANELISDPVSLEIAQVVGHTPHETVTFYDKYGREIYFCDTHSTYRGGAPIGDSSLLVFDGGEAHKISLDGGELCW